MDKHNKTNNNNIDGKDFRTSFDEHFGVPTGGTAKVSNADKNQMRRRMLTAKAAEMAAEKVARANGQTIINGKTRTIADFDEATIEFLGLNEVPAEMIADEAAFLVSRKGR